MLVYEEYKLNERKNEYLRIGDIVERFNHIDEVYGHTSWTLEQIYSNLNILVGKEIEDGKIDMTEGEAEYLKYRFKQYLGSVSRAIQNKRLEKQEMGMTINNLCNSCTNIGCEFQSGIVRTECAFYMPSHIEPDNCGNYVVMQPPAEAIPKAEYENRLKVEREKIAEDVADKMDYMGSCLNKKNIILGVITGKRETLDSLCSICKSESCVSNGTAISKAEYETRLNVDMVDVLKDLKKEMNSIKECEYQIYGREHWNFVGKCQDIIQQKIDKLKENGK